MTSRPIRVVVMGVRDPSSEQGAAAPALVATSEFVVAADRGTAFAESDTTTA